MSGSQAETERRERIARLMAMAEYVWGSPEDGRAFMSEPHPMLDGRTPLEAAATEAGAERVRRLLAALEYSLPI